MKKINVDDILSNKKYGEIRKQKRADLISYKKKDVLTLDLMLLFILSLIKLCFIKFKKCYLLKAPQKVN